MTLHEAVRRALFPIAVLILALLAHDALQVAAQSAPAR